MGWSQGSEIATKIWESVEDELPPAQRQRFARKLISIFEDYDCDTMGECDEIRLAARRRL